MNNLVSFNPFSTNSLFDSFFNGFEFSDFKSSIKVNIKEDEKNYQLDFLLPGIKKDEVNLNIEDNILTVSSKQTKSNEEKDDNYIRREFSYSSFEKSYQLPDYVDIDKISAKHENGILKVKIPKTKNPEIKKTIKIE